MRKQVPENSRKSKKSKARRALQRPRRGHDRVFALISWKFSTFAFSRDILSVHFHLFFPSSLNLFFINPFSLSLSLSFSRHHPLSARYKLAGPDRLVDQARATSSTLSFIFLSIIVYLHLRRLSGRSQTPRQKRLQAAVSVINKHLPTCFPL